MRCEEAHRGTMNTSTAARRHQGFGSAHTSLGERGRETLHLHHYRLRVVLPQAADAFPCGRPSLASAANHLHIMPLPEYSLKAPWWDTSSPSQKILPSEQDDFVAHNVNQRFEKGAREAPEISLGNHTGDTWDRAPLQHWRCPL